MGGNGVGEGRPSGSGFCGAMGLAKAIDWRVLSIRDPLGLAGVRAALMVMEMICSASLSSSFAD